MRIRVTSTVDRLAADMADMPAEALVGMVSAVREHADEGNKLAQTYAKAGAGIHGLNYFKRLSAEMIDPLVWEYGPEGDPKSDFIGVGFRSGVNLDLPRSADVTGVKLLADVKRLADRLFW